MEAEKQKDAQNRRAKALDLLKKTDVWSHFGLGMVYGAHPFFFLFFFPFSQANFDFDHALVLTKMYDYKEGVLLLYERAKLWGDPFFLFFSFLFFSSQFSKFPISRIFMYRFKEIVQYYMDNNEYSNVLLCCKKYG